jgi:FtsZ-interacting cell division protein ZipA
MDLDFSSLQGVMVIIGPIVLAAVLLWAVLNNRTSRAQKQRTEDATKRVRDEQNREDVAQER